MSHAVVVVVRLLASASPFPWSATRAAVPDRAGP